MNNTKLALSAALLGALVAAPAAHAQVTVGTDLVSHYVWRGYDLADGGPLVQPWVMIQAGKTGLSGFAWTSYALSDRDRVTGSGGARSDLDEIDAVVRYDRPVGPAVLTAGAVHIGWYNTAAVDEYPSEETSTWETFAGVGFPALPLAPTVTAYYDHNMGDGWYFNLTGGQAIPGTEKIGVPLNVSYSVGYMDQNWRPEAGFSDITVGVGSAFNFGKLSVAPSVSYTRSPESGPLPADDIVWGKLSVSYRP